VELTTLVIPSVNDTEDGLSGIARRIKKELGDDTPWHVTGYYPAYRFSRELYVPPTPVSTLEKVRDIGKAEGRSMYMLEMCPDTRMRIPTVLAVTNY